MRIRMITEDILSLMCNGGDIMDKSRERKKRLGAYVWSYRIDRYSSWTSYHERSRGLYHIGTWYFPRKVGWTELDLHENLQTLLMQLPSLASQTRFTRRALLFFVWLHSYLFFVGCILILCWLHIYSLWLHTYSLWLHTYSLWLHTYSLLVAYLFFVGCILILCNIIDLW